MMDEELKNVRVSPRTAESPENREKARSALRGGMPGMRSAVVWAEILGKPRALRGRR